MSNDEIKELRAELDKSFSKVQEDLGKVFVAFENLRNADATSDVADLLEELEKTVKKVRTGGIFGRGANSHSRARNKWLEASGQAD